MGLSDICATVTVPKLEYEKLVRDSEKLEVLRKIRKAGSFITDIDLKAILDIEEPCKGEAANESL